MRYTDLIEARRPEAVYTEKKVKGVVDRVIAELSAQQASAFTKLAEQYKEISDLLDQLKKKKDQLSDDIKLRVDDMFDAEDILYTRVVETAKVTATVSKATTYTRKYFDEEGFMTELLDMVPELANEITMLKEQYTRISEEERSPSLRIKIKEDDKEANKSVFRNFYRKVRDLAARVRNRIANWAARYDSRLNNLKSRLKTELE